MKPQLKNNSPSPIEVYLPGQDGRGLYKYMMWFHDDKFTTLKASTQETYLRNGMYFRTGSIQLRTTIMNWRAENIEDIVFARYVIWMWSKMNETWYFTAPFTTISEKINVAFSFYKESGRDYGDFHVSKEATWGFWVLISSCSKVIPDF
jgi:hypothetical protein